MNRPNPLRGLCVFLAAMAVATLAVASRIEQPPHAAAQSAPQHLVAASG